MADQIDPRAKLLEDVWNHADARKLAEKAIKLARPDLEVPGLALREAAEAVETKLQEREAAVDAKILKWEAERQHRQAVDDLSRSGYTDSDVKEIEKIMAEEGIGLHKNAAIVYDNRRQLAAPRTPATEIRSSMSPRAYGRGAFAPYFNGIMEGDSFHNPGEDWARSKADMILQDFKTNRAEAEAKWGDANYWPADPNFPVKA